MFERLHLKDFGRFADTELELDRTTWVVGGNESGKTTVFDAIASCLSPGSARPERYGEAAQARLDGVGLANDGDLWLLHAMPEGGRFTADNETAAAIDARLRAALVAVRAIANQLAAMASDAADSPHNRDLEQLRANLDALAEQWQEIWNSRCELLRSAVEARRLDEELTALDAHIAHQHERADLLAAQLEDERERARMNALRTELEERLQTLLAHREDRDALAGLEGISDAELARAEALEEDLSAHRAQIAAIEARQADGRARLRTIATEIDEARTSLPATKRAAERATATRLRLERFGDQPKQIERQVWHGGRVIAALVFFAAGMASAALLGGTVHFLGLGVGMMLGTCTLALGRQTIREEDSAGEAAFIAQLCGEWNREAGLPPLRATTPSQVVAFCDDNIRAYQQLTTTLDQHVTYKTRVEEELAHILDRSHAMLLNTMPSRQAAVEAWLRDNDVEDRATYAERLRQRKCIEARMVERERAGVVPQLAELEAHEAQAHAEIAALAHHDDDQHESDSDIEALVADHRAAVDLCEQLAAQRQELATRRAALDEATAEPRDLATVLHQIEREQQRIEATIAEIETDKRTAAAAHDLVAGLADTPDLHWQLLNDTLSSLLARAGLDAWQVTLAGLDEASVHVVDAHGRERTLDALGSGAHDLLALACRLALAAELEGDALPFLALEEPFARLDESNTRAALALLGAFQERTDWQIVLISRLRPPAGVLEHARVIDLDAV